MIILIDGYNVLKQQNPGAYIEESTRERLVKILGAYHKRRGHLILLIFDGGTHPWPEQEVKLGIMVIYAGYGKSADDFIKNYIAEHHTEDLFLVSSDRELGLWASKYDIPSMNALPFYAIIRGHIFDVHKNQRQGAAIKTSGHVDPVLDALMIEASERVIPKLDDKQHEHKRRSGQEESKIDKVLRKKIEKL